MPPTGVIEALRGTRDLLTEVLYPARCVSCGRFGHGFLCGDCVTSCTRPVGQGFCKNCAAPWDGDDFCTDCSHWDSLAGGRAAFVHDGPARRAVHALKYGHVRAVAPQMATHVKAILDELEPEAVFAVPLHSSRERRRGYNQAEKMLEAVGVPPAPGTLRRVVDTHSQVGLGLGARRANVGGAFAYAGDELRGMRVGLVDDVVTTGATANECARVLRDFGAKQVWVVAFARANSKSGDA